MKSSDKDRRLDQLISRAPAGEKNKPIPNFDKWLKDHPNAVQSLRMQAQHLRSERLPCRKDVRHGLLSARFPRLARVAGLAAMFLVITSCAVSLVLVRENRMLRQDIRFARQEIAVFSRQQQIEERQESQLRVVSSIQLGAEDQMHRCKSPRVVYYADIPYYSADGPGEL